MSHSSRYAIKKSIVLVGILMLTNLATFAQVTEDFSDTDLTTGTVWSGDLAKYTVINEELNSANSVVNDTFYLSTSSTTALDAEWQIRVHMKLSTSGSNYTDIYLCADDADLKKVQNGYFIRIGGTKDEIALYSVSSGSTSLIIDGPDNKTHNKNINLNVTRSATGLWNVKADYTGGTSYEAVGQVTDISTTTSSYFGMSIRQSVASFHGKHFIDDIYVGPRIVDTQKPAILNTTATDANTITLTADESVGTFGTAFLLDNGYGSPDNIVVNGNDIVLTYSTALINASYELKITGLSDLAGNALDTLVRFDFLQGTAPQPGDIIITELMADPSPPASLPEVEYIEVYNTTTEPLELLDMTLDDGGTPSSFPAYILKSNEYLLICNTGDESLFDPTLNILGMDLPSLNNSGDVLTLKNNNGIQLDVVSYTDKLYGDDLKENGGYSLEKIDLISACDESLNWKASDNPAGGTPGAANSVNGSSNDTQAPAIVSATIEDGNAIRIILDENATNTQLLDPVNYSFSPADVTTLSVTYDVVDWTLTLQLDAALTTNTTYQLLIDTLADCRGNIASQLSTELIATELPVIGDIIINELLFNPVTDGVDFIEIYNTSEKYIRLEDVQLARYTDTIENEVNLPFNRIIYPLEYLALSTDTFAVTKQYPTAKNQVAVDALPPMNNDEGIVLLRSQNITFDSVSYSEDQHFDLLSSTDGVSLERITLGGDGHSPFLWHSASASAGYATPGYQNSQFKSTEKSNANFDLNEKTVSPDGDGYQDQLIINYVLNENGVVLNAYIFGLNGRRIDQPINNTTLSTSGVLTWDGVLSTGSKIPVGNYILLLEYFDLDGKVSKKKLAFSVVGIF